MPAIQWPINGGHYHYYRETPGGNKGPREAWRTWQEVINIRDFSEGESEGWWLITIVGTMKEREELKVIPKLTAQWVDSDAINQVWKHRGGAVLPNCESFDICETPFSSWVSWYFLETEPHETAYVSHVHYCVHWTARCLHVVFMLSKYLLNECKRSWGYVLLFLLSGEETEAGERM